MKAIKENIINDLIEKLNASPFMIVIDYKELTVAQLEGLRGRLTEVGAAAYVTKNSYAKRASGAASYPEELNEYLSGQTALVTGDQDVCAVAKILKEFKKENEKPEMRAGVMDGKLLSPEELNALASLLTFFQTASSKSYSQFLICSKSPKMGASLTRACWP